MTAIRRARAVVVTFEPAGAVATSFLHGAGLILDPDGLAVLAALTAWTPPGDAIARFAGALGDRPVRELLLALLDARLVVARGSAAAEVDAAYAARFTWGAVAGAYHFGIKGTVYEAPPETQRALTEHVARHPAPPAFTDNDGMDRVISLPPPAAGDPTLALMRRRRSLRCFDPERPLPLGALRDCLVAGLAITGFAASSIPGEPALPLAMTPSGGARNPFEAFVVARAVAGLAPGVYHYAGIDSSLGLLSDAPPPPLSTLLGGQRWFDAAAAVVLLVASFERAMWRYPHPTGYRVVLLEAGHIAQNVLLAATARDLAATPTCAVSDPEIEALCGLDPVMHAAVYAIALGVRGPHLSEVDLPVVAPNPRLRWDP